MQTTAQVIMVDQKGRCTITIHQADTAMQTD